MSVTDFCKAQQEWAANRGIAFGARGYVPELDLNLMRPLSPATFSAFANGDGGELLERGDEQAKMWALHSSSALAELRELFESIVLSALPNATLFPLSTMSLSVPEGFLQQPGAVALLPRSVATGMIAGEIKRGMREADSVFPIRIGEEPSKHPTYSGPKQRQTSTLGLFGNEYALKSNMDRRADRRFGVSPAATWLR